MVNYKFNEGALIQELQDYVDSTYNSHYSKGKIQSTEVIIDRGRGLEFCLGNVDKYSNRYGSKGTVDDYRKDLMKILHYALISLYCHDQKYNEDSNDNQINLDFGDEYIDGLTIDLSNTDTISMSTMYNTDNMSYNNITTTVNWPFPDNSGGTINIGPIETRRSIDDCSPEEWNRASAYAYSLDKKGKTKK